MPDVSTTPLLSALLRAALDRNPGIRGARERAAAAGEAAAIAGGLPNPAVTFGWYATPVQTRVGPQRWSVGVKQKIALPSKLGSRADVARSEAEHARLVVERRARDVLVDVVHVAHEIAYLDEAQRITAEVAALLDRYVAATAGDGTGTLLSEQFRAETQRAQLENDRVTLAELRTVETQRLRSLLDLPPTSRVGTPVTPDPPALVASIDELLALAETHSHELREAGVALDSARRRSDLEELRRLPDFTLGVTHVETDRLPSRLGMNPRENGSDPLVLSVGIDLPIWARQDVAAIRRAAALERAAALDHRAAVQRTREGVTRAWYRVGNAERLHRLYEDVLVPRAAAATRTADDLHAAGKGSVGGALETIAVYHNFRLAAARARADRGQAVAELERVVGRPFEAVPVPGGAT